MWSSFKKRAGSLALDHCAPDIEPNSTPQPLLRNSKTGQEASVYTPQNVRGQVGPSQRSTPISLAGTIWLDLPWEWAVGVLHYENALPW